MNHTVATNELVEKWCISIPELQTRSNLVDAMRTDSSLRHSVFTITNAIHSIASLPNKRVASHILAGYEPSLWQQTAIHRDRYHDSNIIVTRELIAFLKNILRTARVRLTGPTQYAKDDVVRENWWREHQPTLAETIAKGLNRLWQEYPLLAEELTRPVPCSDEVDNEFPTYEVWNGMGYSVGRKINILSLLNTILEKHLKGEAVVYMRNQVTRELEGFSTV